MQSKCHHQASSTVGIQMAHLSGIQVMRTCSIIKWSTIQTMISIADTSMPGKGQLFKWFCYLDPPLMLIILSLKWD